MTWIYFSFWMKIIFVWKCLRKSWGERGRCLTVQLPASHYNLWKKFWRHISINTTWCIFWSISNAFETKLMISGAASLFDQFSNAPIGFDRIAIATSSQLLTKAFFTSQNKLSNIFLKTICQIFDYRVLLKTNGRINDFATAILWKNACYYAWRICKTLFTGRGLVIFCFNLR